MILWMPDFYPRPPRGGRLGSSDGIRCRGRFLSTPSARRATTRLGYTGDTLSISIHALREEGDAGRSRFPTEMSISIHALREEGDGGKDNIILNLRNFYPRPPRGGRLKPMIESQVRTQFLSTPSARRATNGWREIWASRSHFYPRPPRGGRRCGNCGQAIKWEFLSTPSARRATISIMFRRYSP